MATDRIKQLRKQNGFTQTELARELGVSVSSIAMWETGKRTPNFTALNDLSSLFDRKIEYILGTSDDDKSVKLSEADIDQLGAWETQSYLIDMFRQYLALDEYGKMNVDALIKRESVRCQEQGTRETISNIKVAVQYIERKDKLQEEDQFI